MVPVGATIRVGACSLSNTFCTGTVFLTLTNSVGTVVADSRSQSVVSGCGSCPFITYTNPGGVGRRLLQAGSSYNVTTGGSGTAQTQYALTFPSPPPAPPPLSAWTQQVFDTVTVVGIDPSQWDDDFAAAYVYAYYTTYTFVNPYLTNTYLTTSGSTLPACASTPCTDINTLFYVASPTDLTSLTTLLTTATVVDNSSGALWTNLVASGLAVNPGFPSEGATSFVRRGFVPFATFDDPSVFASLNSQSVTVNVTSQLNTYNELVGDPNGMSALAASLGTFLAGQTSLNATQLVTTLPNNTPTESGATYVTVTAYDASFAVASAAISALTNAILNNQSAIVNFVATNGLSGVTKLTTYVPPPPPSPPPPSPPPSPPPIAYWAGGDGATMETTLTLVGVHHKTWTSLKSGLVKEVIVQLLNLTTPFVQVDSQANAVFATADTAGLFGTTVNLRLLAPQNRDVQSINATFMTIFGAPDPSNHSTWKGQGSAAVVALQSAGISSVTFVAADIPAALAGAQTTNGGLRRMLRSMY